MTQPEPLGAVLAPSAMAEPTGVLSADLEVFIAEHHLRLLRLARIVCRDGVHERELASASGQQRRIADDPGPLDWQTAPVLP